MMNIDLDSLADRHSREAPWARFHDERASRHRRTGDRSAVGKQIRGSTRPVDGCEIFSPAKPTS